VNRIKNVSIMLLIVFYYQAFLDENDLISSGVNFKLPTIGHRQGKWT